MQIYLVRLKTRSGLVICFYNLGVKKYGKEYLMGEKCIKFQVFSCSFFFLSFLDNERGVFFFSVTNIRVEIIMTRRVSVLHLRRLNGMNFDSSTSLSTFFFPFYMCVSENFKNLNFFATIPAIPLSTQLYITIRYKMLFNLLRAGGI